jgi:hypothetical protein
MNVDGSGVRACRPARGATCGYFAGRKADHHASTHASGAACPPKPSYARLRLAVDAPRHHLANADGGGLAITTTPGYDAEATIASDGRIAFTGGDMEIYSMNGDGSDVRR